MKSFSVRIAQPLPNLIERWLFIVFNIWLLTFNPTEVLGHDPVVAMGFNPFEVLTKNLIVNVMFPQFPHVG